MNDMIEKIADCLLQNHMELMAEVKHLREEVSRLNTGGGLGLTHEEMTEIINGNIKITDPLLLDAVYAVALDIEIAVMDKNGLLEKEWEEE
jgi:hypothetical protein